MTEGVIIIPFFILIWMGLNLLHITYVERLRAQGEAKNAVLEMASAGNCGQADMSLDQMSQTSGMEPGMNSQAQDMITSITGYAPFAWSHSSTSITQTIQTKESFTVTGNSILMCNTKPVDGLMDLVSSLVKEILGIENE